MERNILLIYVGWELVNLFLGGVLSASLVRWGTARTSLLCQGVLHGRTGLSFLRPPLWCFIQCLHAAQ
jgi:hypothetical protein